jgi:hypothetical protein
MHLLNLPAELRNRTYEYALTDSTSTGLECKELPDDSDTQSLRYAITLHSKPFNTLKNVCRQLRTETTGLELAYNTLIFTQEDHTAPPPTDLLDQFLDQASDAGSTNLSAITLKSARTASYRPKEVHFARLVRLADWA